MKRKWVILVGNKWWWLCIPSWKSEFMLAIRWMPEYYFSVFFLYFEFLFNLWNFQTYTMYPDPISLPPIPSRISYLFYNCMSLLYNFINAFVFTHWVKFMLPICAWVWDEPLGHGKPTSGHHTPSWSSYHLPIAPQLRWDHRSPFPI